MENTPHLYETLVLVLCQHATWVDQRHLKTLAWMMVGLIHSGWINLTAWAPYVVSRAQYAQSTVRRFRRWLVVYPNSADNFHRSHNSVKCPHLNPFWRGQGHDLTSVCLPTHLNRACMALR